MKVFQIRFLTILILSFSLLGASILIPNSLAQKDTQIPNWIKDVAGWWANDEISENEFLTGIEYLMNNNIISINFVPCSIIESQTDSSVNLVPNWIKNNAEWWSKDLISDIDFINGLTYLIDNQIMQIDNTKIKGDVPIEDIHFSPAWTIDKTTLAWTSSGFFEIFGTIGQCLTSNDRIAKWYTTQIR